MPEMIEYSVVAAVHTIWLAARAEGIGLGWISILDPARMAEILDVPPDWHLIGHLCLGSPDGARLAGGSPKAGETDLALSGRPFVQVGP